MTVCNRYDGNGKNREIAIFEERVGRQRTPVAGLQSECEGACSVLKLRGFGLWNVCGTTETGKTGIFVFLKSVCVDNAS